MRILQVIDSLYRGGGAEKLALDLALTLKNREGVDVDILSIGPPKNNDFVNEAEKNGVSHHCLSNKSISWKNIFKLRRFLLDGKYDIIHVHLFPALYMVPLSLCFHVSKSRLIFTEHSTSNKRRGKIIFRLIEHFIYNRYNRVVAISPEVAKNVIDHANISNVDIVPNGVDIDEIDKTPVKSSVHNELNLSTDSVVLTMVGRFVPGKDQSTLIQSLAYLPENVHVVCVGDGVLRESVQEQTEKEPYANRVHFLGLRKDVISILKSSDIIVLSSEHEGFSLSMLEAMACRKPFVASAVPGIEDLVENNAILFEYQDARSLADGVQKLIDDKSLYAEMSNKSRQFAERYDLKLIAKKYLSTYKQ